MKIVKTLFLVTAMLAIVACGGREKDENKMLNEECLICGAPLEYLTQDTLMECVLCHKQEPSKTRCVNGHYVCNDCHTQGMDSIIAMCMEERSRNPIEILEKMMSKPFCHMHGPEHHVLVGAALLTAYNNCLPDSAKLDMANDLVEVMERGRQVPGGACGYMGACGAAISTGIFMSVVTRNTPLSTDTWRLCNLMTSKALEQVAENGGPRCCKRDSYLSVLTAIDFVIMYVPNEAALQVALARDPKLWQEAFEQAVKQGGSEALERLLSTGADVDAPMLSRTGAQATNAQATNALTPRL